MEKRKYLTKSRYAKARTCKKRLWLLVHNPPEYGNDEPSGPAATGIRVGELARGLFPEGVLVEAAPWAHSEAVETTQALMADKSVTAIFEAAFEFDGMRIRCDILERRPRGRWILREVKASKQTKEDHLYDVASQVHVLRGAGMRLESFGIQHLNGDYRLGKGGLNLKELFTFSNLSDIPKAIYREVEAEITDFQAILRKRKSPNIEASLHCPGDCEFYEDCHADLPDDWIRYLPSVGQKRFDALNAEGILSIVDIPDDFALTATQERIRASHKTDKPYISNDIKTHLRQFGPPAFYLDFETMMPAVPIYPGTSPYQQIPFQWSVHHVSRNGKQKHWEYLAKGEVDPRRELAEKLIAVLSGKKEPVISYSAYERTVLGLLKAACPDLSAELNDIINRLQDLLPLVRGHTYLPEYGFSYSIKYVAPGLVKDFGYDDLEGIAEGMGAAVAFERIARIDLSPGESENELRAALLAYCKRDTEAMVEVHRALIKLGGGVR